MVRKSSIDRLPQQIQAEIGRLNQLGWTLDQILEHLRTLLDVAPSRSALGRHVQRVERTMARLRQTRQISEAVARSLGDAPDSVAARVNAELLQGIIFDLLSMGEDGAKPAAGDEEGEGGEPRLSLAQDPKAIAQVAKAIRDLAGAAKVNVDYIAAAEARAAAQARRDALAAAADTAASTARESGLSADTVARMRRDILGLRPPEAPPAAGAPA
jgi:hypothetical protein